MSRIEERCMNVKSNLFSSRSVAVGCVARFYIYCIFSSIYLNFPLVCLFPSFYDFLILYRTTTISIEQTYHIISNNLSFFQNSCLHLDLNLSPLNNVSFTYQLSHRCFSMEIGKKMIMY